MKYTTTILSIAVHPETDHPVFGGSSTHVRIEDEAGGPFIILSQCPDNPVGGEIRLDFNEIELITAAIKTLREQPVIRKLLDESNQNSTVQ